MANPNSRSADQQRISPSTAYDVKGSPDDYQYILRGADLVLVDKNQQEHVFLFVGNIMSLDGNVNMNFSDGQSLGSDDLFNRSEMPDMEKKEEEAPAWEVKSDNEEGSEGNGDEPKGLNEPEVPAQALPVLDPTDAILEAQRQLIQEISEKGGERGEGSSQVTPKDSGDNGDGDDKGDEKEQKEEVKEEEVKKEEEKKEIDDDDDEIISDTLALAKPTINVTEDTDNGKLDDDGVTNNQDPDFEGTAVAGAKIEIFVDGVLKDTVLADADGNFSSDKVHGFNAGDYTITAVASNAAGETAASTPLNLVIDVTAPTLPTVTLEAGESGGELYTNDLTPRVHGMDGDPDGYVILSYIDAAGNEVPLSADINVGSDGSWEYTLTEAQALVSGGKYSFKATSVDLAGNEVGAFTYLHNVNIDTDPPTSTIALDAGSDSYDLHAGEFESPGIDPKSDNYTKEDTLNLTITTSADTKSVEIFKVVGTDLVSIGDAKFEGGKWVFEVSNSEIPADGTYKFMAQSTDNAGNIELQFSNTTLEVEIDRTPPAAPTIDLITADDTADSDALIGSSIDNHTNAKILHLEGTAVAGAPIDLYVTIDGVETRISEQFAEADGTWEYAYDATAYGTSGNEELVFKAVALDKAGNAAESLLTVVVDHDNPDIPTIGLADLQGVLDTSIPTDVATVRNATATLEGLITEDSTEVVLSLYQVELVEGEIVSRTKVANNIADNGGLGDITITDNGDGTFSWSYDYGALVDGNSYSFITTVEDKAGNFSERDSKIFTIDVDTSISPTTLTLDDSTDTTGGAAELAGTGVGDNYTGLDNNGDGTVEDTEKHLNLKVTGSTDATIVVYLVDASGADITLSDGSVVAQGTVVGEVTHDAVDGWLPVEFDASAYTGTTTPLEFVAVSTDTTGNTSYKEYSVTLDDENPYVDNIVDLDDAYDTGSGAEAHDNITAAKKIILTGTLKEGSEDVTVTIYDDGVHKGVANISFDEATGVGTWTYTIGDDSELSKYISSGEHSYTAVVEDNAGNQSTTSEALVVTIDRGISAPTFVLDSDSDSGRVDSDNITNETDLTFNGSSDVGDTVTVYMTDSSGVKTEVGHFVATAESWSYVVGLSNDRGTGTGIKDSVYSADASLLNADGDYTFHVDVEDTAGNSASSVATDIEVDRTTADLDAIDYDVDMADVSDSSYQDTDVDGTITTIGKEGVVTNSDTVTFTGAVSATSVEAYSKVNLYEADGTLVDSVVLGESSPGVAETSWSIDVASAGLSEGTHEYYVKYVDLAGNESVKSDAFEMEIDRTNPVDLAINMTSVSTVYDGKTFTSDTTPSFEIVGADSKPLEAGTVLHIKVDGDTVKTYTVTDADVAAGHYSFDPSEFAEPASSNGEEHSVTVIAVDMAGNTSAVATSTFTLDTKTGTIDHVQLVDADNSGTNEDSITSNLTPRIEGQGEAGSTIEVTLTTAGEADIVLSAVVDSDGKWVTTAPATELSDGKDYNVSVTATKGGIVSVPNDDYSFTIDESIVDVAFGMVETAENDTGYLSTDNITNNATPSFEWTAQEDLTATINIYSTDDAINPVGTYTVPAPTDAGGQVWAIPASLADGDYVIKAVFTDVADNQTTESTIPFTVDTVDPVLADVSLVETLDSGVNTDWLTNDENVDGGLGISGTVNEDVRLFVYVNGTLVTTADMIAAGHDYIEATAGAVGGWNFDLSGLTIGDGLNAIDAASQKSVNTVKVVAVDEAGNETEFTETLTVDSEVVPVGEILLHTDSDSGIKDDFTTNDTTPTLRGITEAGSLVELYYGGSKVGEQVATAGEWAITVPDTILVADGDYAFKAVITDTAGNVAETAERIITLDSDPVAPTVTMSVDSKGDFFGTDSDFVTNDTTPEFTITTEVDTKLEIFQDDVLVGTVERGDNTGSFVYDQSALTEGTYTYKFVSTDSVGNTTETTQTVVIDPAYIADELSITLDPEYDSGLNTDGLTRFDSPKLNITAEDGSKIHLYVSEKFDSEAEAIAATLSGSPVEKSLSDGETTWEHTPSALGADGFYKITVVSEDEAGNQQTKFTIINLDKTPPEVPTFVVTNDDGTAVADPSSYTDLTPRFAGTADKDSSITTTVEVKNSLGEVELSFEADVQPDGTWSYQMSADTGDWLEGGDYTVAITSKDAADNKSDATSAFTIVQDDSVAPTIKLLSTDDTGSLNDDGVTSLNESLQGTDSLTLIGTSKAFSTVDIYEETSTDVWTKVSSVEAAENGTWSYDLVGVTDDGTHKYRAESSYIAAESAVLTVIVDSLTAVPGLDLIEDTSVADSWIPGGDDWQTDGENKTDEDWVTSRPTVTGLVEAGSTTIITATDADGVVTVFDSIMQSSNGDGTDSYTGDLSELGNGTYTIVVSTTDIAGNQSSTAEKTLVVDLGIEAPTIDMATDDDSALKLSGDEILMKDGTDAGPATLSDLVGAGYSLTDDGDAQNADNHTYVNDIPLSGTAEAGSKIRITVTRNDLFYDSTRLITVDSTGEWTQSFNDLTDANYTFTVTSIDLAGNESVADTLNLTVDAVATRAAQVDLYDDGDTLTGDSTPVLALYGDNDSTYLLYLKDNDTGNYSLVDSGTFNGSSNALYTVPDGSELSEGEHTYKLVTADQAGNVQVATDYVVTVDLTPPETGAITAQNEDTTVVSISVDGATGENMLYTDNNDSTLTVTVKEGTSYVILTASDGEGYTARAEVVGGVATFDLTGDTVLVDGSYPYNIEFFDAVDNHDAANDLAFNLVVDIVDPVTEIEMDPASDLGFNKEEVGKILTSGETLVFKGLLTELGLGQDSGDFTTDISYVVTVTNDVGDTWTLESDYSDSSNANMSMDVNADGTYELTIGTVGNDLANGNYTATVAATDLAENVHSSSLEFTVENNDLATPDLEMTLRDGDEIKLYQEDYLDTDAAANSNDYADYKTEMDFSGKNAAGEDVSLNKVDDLSSSGKIREYFDADELADFDYVGIKVVDEAGNESDTQYIDLDETDLNFAIAADVDADNDGVAEVSVDEVQFTITGDNGVFITGNAAVNIDSDGDGTADSWSMDFADDLGAGNYTLQIKGIDSDAGAITTVGGDSTYDFSILADEMTSSDQVFSAEHEDLSTAGGGGAGGGGGASTDNVVIEAEVHVDHIEGSLA